MNWIKKYFWNKITRQQENKIKQLTELNAKLEDSLSKSNIANFTNIKIIKEQEKELKHQRQYNNFKNLEIEELTQTVREQNMFITLLKQKIEEELFELDEVISMFLEQYTYEQVEEILKLIYDVN
jgi:hypothetical protein